MADGPHSKAQLDKLGERLRAGSSAEADLRDLDAYRRSFRAAYEFVMGSLSLFSRLERTGRPAKTPGAIIDKLNRQRIRLTQIQDIAGIRLVCDHVPDQDLIVRWLGSRFPTAQLDDRRIKPSHGYRAAHVIVPTEFQRSVEIQVRTKAQDRWAQVSEKLANLIDPGIKYGAGPKQVRRLLAVYSDAVRQSEELERQHDDMLHVAHELLQRKSDAATSAEHERLSQAAEELQERVRTQRGLLERSLEDMARVALMWPRNPEEDDKS